MALSAAQATYKRSPIALMLTLWAAGFGLRCLCLSAWPSFGPSLGLDPSDGESLAEQVARLHTDSHVSVYNLVTFAAQALGAQSSLLRSSALLCDAAQAFVWLVWLRARDSRAAHIYLSLWAASPLLVHTATSPGPHAALGLWTTLGFVALWAVWQQQHPSKAAQLWLLVAWALLVSVHPLGVLAVAAMVLTALAWPKASAQALSNSLNTTVGQAGRLALNVGQPALVAGIVYLGMRLLGHIYPTPEAAGASARLGVGGVGRILSAAFGTDAACAMGPWQVAWPLPQAAGAALTAIFICAGLSHPTGQKLVSIAVLYGLSLAAYNAVVPVFNGPTLVPAFIMLLAGGALGLGQARARGAVRVFVAALALWQLNLWLSACRLFALPF